MINLGGAGWYSGAGSIAAGYAVFWSASVVVVSATAGAAGAAVGGL